jgi:radical SAM protein with 4Fe4S-binding SPASM domain
MTFLVVNMENVKDIKPWQYYHEFKTNESNWAEFRSKEYWEYRKKWTDIPQSMTVTDFPIHLDIETTSYCNLECKMCARTILMNEGTDYIRGQDVEFPMDKYKEIIDEGAGNGLCSVKLQYNGEPLADSKIVERVKYAKDKGILDVMFNTNATLLTEEMSWKLLEAGLDDIFFSAESIDPETYNKIRVGADFHQVVANIKKFMQVKKEGKFDHVQTRISSIRFPNTKEEEVEEYKNFWLPIVGSVGYIDWVNQSTGKNEFEQYNPDFVCAQPFQRLFILYEGSCTPCCIDVRKSYSLGSIYENTVKDIWHGEKLTKLRELHMAGKYRDVEMCRKCLAPVTKADGKATPELVQS